MQAYVLAKVHSPICRANGLCWECNGNSVGKSGWAECERPRVNPAWGIQLPRKYLGNSEVPHGFFFFFFWHPIKPEKYNTAISHRGSV